MVGDDGGAGRHAVDEVRGVWTKMNETMVPAGTGRVKASGGSVAARYGTRYHRLHDDDDDDDAVTFHSGSTGSGVDRKHVSSSIDETMRKSWTRRRCTSTRATAHMAANAAATTHYNARRGARRALNTKRARHNFLPSRALLELTQTADAVVCTF
jgi:hypothetical protein